MIAKIILALAITGASAVLPVAANTTRLQVADDSQNSQQREQAFAALASSLPPDPGMAGTLTLEGIDLDGNGIRDDVQWKIAQRYPSEPSKRAALMQLAAAISQSMMTYNQELEDKKAISVTGEPIARAAACATFQNVIPDFPLKEIEQWITNTPERQLAYSALNDYLSVNGDFYNYTVEGAANCDSTFYQNEVR